MMSLTKSSAVFRLRLPALIECFVDLQEEFDCLASNHVGLIFLVSNMNGSGRIAGKSS